VAVAAAISVVHARRVHEARENPVGFLLVVGRQLEFVILDALVLAEGTLERIDGAEEQDSAREQPEDFPNTHRMGLFVLSLTSSKEFRLHASTRMDQVADRW